MSRTRESTNIVSPVEVAIFFNGNSGKFGRPSENENDQMVDMTLPFSFVVLDDGAYRVTGETRGTTKRKIQSNLAHRDFSNYLEITYKDNGELIAKGEMRSVSEDLKTRGCKYTAVLYVLTKIDGAYKMASIWLRGRALAEWYKFTKGKNPMGDMAYTVKDVVKTAGEEIDSYVPVFAEVKISPATIEEANAADLILQEWMKATFSVPVSDGVARPIVERGPSEPSPMQTAAATVQAAGFVPDHGLPVADVTIYNEAETNDLPF